EHPEGQILMVGKAGGPEERLVPAAGLALETVPIRGLDRDAAWKNLALPAVVPMAMRRGLRILDSFHPDVVLGMGGYAMAPAVWEVLPELLQRFGSVIHLAGRQGAAEVERVVAELPGYRGLAFTDDMAALMAEADLVVSRAGVGTIGEVSAVGLPMILVPGTFGGAHQALNAQAVMAAGAAASVPDAEFTGRRLLAELDGLDAERLRAMSAASSALGRPAADRRVLRVVEQVAS